MDKIQSNETIEKIAFKLRMHGPMSSRALQEITDLSQPQLSRYLKRLKKSLVRIGKGKSTLYAHTKELSQVGSQISIYQVTEKGRLEKLGTLYPIAPKGFYWEVTEEKLSRLFNDLPYFLNDLRPTGFLGRIIPRTHLDWGFPKDIRLWTAESTLRYLTNFGVDLVGNQILGENAAQKFLKETLHKVEANKRTSEIEKYQELARIVEEHGIPGSSAGGEHPKFLTRRLSDDIPVIVKFVLNGDNLITQRRIDLLRAEHIASSILSTSTLSAATRIIESPSHTFLEIMRFDRIGSFGRKGIISLLSLDAEFVGSGESWSIVAQKLLDLDIINQEIVDEIQFREYFGNFIGNSDMHSGNISFFFENEKIQNIAPVYDMLPMMYAPVQERISLDSIKIIPPNPQSIMLWEKARVLALRYWQAIQNEGNFSSSFIEIANRNEKLLLTMNGNL